ncbi:type II/IV secretion system ATPase tadZ/cpaE [Vibrio ishigakensis]|uniref:Type II/IV secretion system ATPase tadZ/cpaE n=1 Tax=Vibrio ishigakensis TaxID=1481914 RepID=A0A0B8QU53_9VIBR|nr:type II/IV secretion system ATPase tadZ/cpaE [Vibrio ishigakensis]
MSEIVKITPKNNNFKLVLKSHLQIWVVFSADSFRNHLQKEFTQCNNATLEFMELERLSEGTLNQSAAPDLMFVQASGDWAQKVSELYSNNGLLQAGNTTLIVFGDESDNIELKTALRIGASDFLSETSSLESLSSLLKTISDEKLSSRHLSELYTFINSKGGSGASTVAMNVAIELAKNEKNKVLFLDLDVQFGAIQDYLDLQPQHGLHDVIDGVTDLDEVSLDALVTKHSCGMYFLNFQQLHPIENELKARDLHKVFPLLRQYYTHIVTDLSRGIEANYGTIISLATKNYVVAQQGYVSLKNTNDLLSVLELEFGAPRAQIEVVINRYDKKNQLKITDIEEALGDVRVHVLPNDYKTVNESSNLGKPFALNKKKTPISVAVGHLANSIIPQTEQETSWLKKLFS